MAGEGMVHLDVKPDNIVMGVPPRLIDLSIARTVERAARLRNPIGTDAYMAPEQCVPREHPGAVGPPADVWGLGATLHHAVSGRSPFPRERGDRDSEDPRVRFPQVDCEPAPLPDGTPPALVELLAGTLAKDPARRPTAAELVLGLEPLVAELPRRLVLGRRSSRWR
jgi:serine/threonine protein kinase